MNMENSNLMLYNLTPDLLERGELIKILNDRCIDLPKVDTMSKDALVALYLRVVAPLPQRTRCGGQPQHMPLLQKSRGFSIGFSSATSSPSFEPNCRLKPPPDASSTTRNKVKITTSKSECSSHLDNIIINDRTKRSVQIVAGKSKDERSSSPISGLNALERIVINCRSNVKSVPEIEQMSESSNSVLKNEVGNIDHSMNLVKPRIKLKRSSINAGSSQEHTTQIVEPEIKKPKTKIVF